MNSFLLLNPSRSPSKVHVIRDFTPCSARIHRAASLSLTKTETSLHSSNSPSSSAAPYCSFELNTYYCRGHHHERGISLNLASSTHSHCIHSSRFVFSSCLVPSLLETSASAADSPSSPSPSGLLFCRL